MKKEKQLEQRVCNLESQLSKTLDRIDQLNRHYLYVLKMVHKHLEEHSLEKLTKTKL